MVGNIHKISKKKITEVVKLKEMVMQVEEQCNYADRLSNKMIRLNLYFINQDRG